MKSQREIQRGKNVIRDTDKSCRNGNEGRWTLLEKIEPDIQEKET